MPASTKREQTHARIVEAAARALRREGFAGVGVADVMKQAGLTHGGFYAHFASREALLLEAVALAGALVGTLQLARTMGPEGAGLLLLTQGKAALLAQYAVS